AVVALYNWTGGYIGINGGGAWGRSRWFDNGDGSDTGNFNTSGGLFGGTLGYNWQSNALVFGLEGDIDWSSIKGSTSTLCAPNCETRNTWLGTVRGRIGYAGWDRVLIYATGGVAFGNIKSGLVGGPTDDKSQAGWALGGGAEFALSAPWTAKIEYLYVDLGKTSCSIASCAGTGITDVKFNANILRGGLNYRF